MNKIRNILYGLLWIGLTITLLGNTINKIVVTMIGITVMGIPAIVLAGIELITEED